MKTCTKCGIAKEAVAENFRLRKGKLNSQCRQCEREYSKKWSKDNPERVYERNKQWREDNREHYQEYMKDYNKEYHQKYYEENKEMLMDKQREYRKDNEKVKANQQRYYQENREYILERSKKWREANPEKCSEMAKNWWARNKDKRREYNQTRRAKVRELEADLTVEQWAFIKDYFNQCCAYCGKKNKLHQDHFIPVNDGGGYTITNIIPACQKCNSSKHDNNFFEWYPKYKCYSPEREEKILNFLFDVKVLGK